MNNERYNIYRIDDVLIKVGYIFLVLFILAGGTAVSTMIRQALFHQSDSLFIATASLFIPSAVFLMIGYHFRAMEQVTAAILNNLTIARVASVADLVKSTGYSRRAVEQALLLINRRGFGYYVYDRGSDRIVDGRLRRKMVLVDRCDRCGSGISKSFPASQDEPPQCPYCGMPVGHEEWNAMKARAIEDIRNEETRYYNPSKPGQGIPDSSRGKTSFSLGLFIILLLLFWPAAIIYAAVRYNR